MDERRNDRGGEDSGGAGADGLDEGDGGMALALSVWECGEGGGSTGVVGVGDGTGTGDELGECGMGDGEAVGVVGDMAMDGDEPRLN